MRYNPQLRTRRVIISCRVFHDLLIPPARLSGLTDTLLVSFSVEPNTSRSAIAFNSVYRLKFLIQSLRQLCLQRLSSVPTRGGFYTSKVSLRSSALLRIRVPFGLDICLLCPKSRPDALPSGGGELRVLRVILCHVLYLGTKPT